MAWIGWGLIICSLLSPGWMSGERQQSHGGFRRLYVVQPGPGPRPTGLGAGVRVSSISTHHGAAGQPHTYNVELSADLGAQVRTRGMRSMAGLAPQQQLMQLSGVNVCGGHCCHGWSKALGSQRCTKPNCIPQCQNGGMCLRPQLCVCKPGSKGNACEHKTEATQPFPALPENAPNNGHTIGQTNRYNLIPQRPIPQQLQPNGFSSSSNMAQMKLTVKPSQFMQPHYAQQHIQQQTRPISLHPGQSKHVIVKPKYYSSHTIHTQTNVQAQSGRPIPLIVGQNSINAGNHTGRIKVVFTPTICKLACTGSRCHNNCELGNTTTIISENGHTTDTLTAPNFRVVVCHLPCMNGGKCSSRDKCQCPPNFTGKFCQMPLQNGNQEPLGGYTQVHSTHTLPLTYSSSRNPEFAPGIVNIHIKHPPEASVQVHQVSQVDNYQTDGHKLKDSQLGSSSSTSYSFHHTESSQKIQHHGYSLVYPGQHGYQIPQHLSVTTKNTLGRCFQETAGSQCGKALPGLTKQEQCCGTVGTSWGFHKCQKCPKKQPISLIDCPQGYRRINSSDCQDLDDCQLQGVCPNGTCVNTAGSYRCICKPGYVPDPTFTTCTPKFKEICPGGMGYTILPNPPVNKPVTAHQEPTDLLSQQPQPTPERPVEAFRHPEVIIPEVIEKTSPPVPVEILPSNAGQDIAPIQSAEVDECQIDTYICGPGICYNTAKSYTCHCDEGYGLDAAQTTCIDIDECLNNLICPSGICYNTPGGYSCGSCPNGFLEQFGQCVDVDECVEEPRPCIPLGECVNTLGLYYCTCTRGYQQINGTSCRDVDECIEKTELCFPHGKCHNTEGSYTCVCDSGFTASIDMPICEDIDECGLDETLCGLHGFCENRLGSFQCLCDQGYQVSQDNKGCMDVNECELLSSVCGEAQCVNVDGSFMCVCPSGQDYNVMVGKCEPLPTASSVERKECYYRLNDENLCESVLTSHVTLQECCCTLGAGWGDNCEVHPCPVNETDHFNRLCPSGRGFVPNGDSLYGLPISYSYTNADECTLFGQEVCEGGFCLDTKGSYECYCKTGQDYDPVRLQCRDIDECQDESICVGGQCLNTEGSYMCFCTHPMVLDPSSSQCVIVPEVGEQHDLEQVDYQGICWEMVTKTQTCTRPLGPNRKTTYTECCCLYGEAWGMDCALCPPRNTDDYASMCNLPPSSNRRPYGHDALVADPQHKYEASLDYAPSPEEQPIRPYYGNEEHPYDAFKGLHVEECGILNGCENGRCVRVQEGYTCDCFDGYTLDLSRMACIDVNECSELETLQVPLCKNAKCINTIGSYRCVCLPGFKGSNKRNYCVQVETNLTSTPTQ